MIKMKTKITISLVLILLIGIAIAGDLILRDKEIDVSSARKEALKLDNLETYQTRDTLIGDNMQRCIYKILDAKTENYQEFRCFAIENNQDALIELDKIEEEFIIVHADSLIEEGKSKTKTDVNKGITKII